LRLLLVLRVELLENDGIAHGEGLGEGVREGGCCDDGENKSFHGRGFIVLLGGKVNVKLLGIQSESHMRHLCVTLMLTVRQVAGRWRASHAPCHCKNSRPMDTRHPC
jgi:hypothetical protein